MLFAVVVLMFAVPVHAERGVDPAKSEIALDKLKRTQKRTGKNLFTSKPWGTGTHRFVRTKAAVSVTRPAQLPAAPVAPPMPFAYMGKMLDEESGKLVLYLSKGDVPYVVTVGEVIDGMYRIEAASETELTLIYLPLNTRQKLIIGESNS
jgi:hypothetical protein